MASTEPATISQRTPSRATEAARSPRARPRVPRSDAVAVRPGVRSPNGIESPYRLGLVGWLLLLLLVAAMSVVIPTAAAASVTIPAVVPKKLRPAAATGRTASHAVAPPTTPPKPRG